MLAKMNKQIWVSWAFLIPIYVVTNQIWKFKKLVPWYNDNIKICYVIQYLTPICNIRFQHPFPTFVPWEIHEFVCLQSKVHMFWEGHNILRNLHQLFALCTASQIIGGDFAKFVAFSEYMKFTWYFLIFQPFIQL